MFFGSFVVFLLMAFLSPAKGSTTLATVATPAPAASGTATAATAAATAAASQTAAAQASATTGAVPVTAPAPSATGAAPSSASASVTPTSGSSEKPSCATIKFVANHTWNETLGDKNSDMYKNGADYASMVFKALYNDTTKYDDIKLSDVVYTKKDSLTMVEAKLCLVVENNDGPFIEDVLTAKVNTGKLHDNFQVISGTTEYKALGIELSGWKAKDGECDNKCGGGGGEFTIEATCEAKTNSCKGQKKTKMSDDCVEYCPSSAAISTISFFILAIGASLSFSFQ